MHKYMEYSEHTEHTTYTGYIHIIMIRIVVYKKKNEIPVSLEKTLDVIA